MTIRMKVNTSTRRQRQQGMTLLELLITMVIFSIALAIGVPAIQNSIDRGRLSGQGKELRASLGFARAEAVATSASVGVCASSDQATCTGDWNEGWIIYRDTNNNGVFTGGEEILRRHEAVERSTITAEDTGGTAVTNLTFNYRGQANGRVTFQMCPTTGDTTIGSTVYLEATGRAMKKHNPAGCP